MRLRKSVLATLLLLCMLVNIISVGATPASASGNPYYIKVNKATNVVTVYRSDGTPHKAFVCSTGYATPIGTFSTSQKLRWHVLDGPSYGQYCSRITGSILFHSVWYYVNGNKASQSTVQYNRLGTTASHGCVRLTVEDSKWIYDNCPLGTKVTIFNGKSSDDPLGKPVPIKVNVGTGRGWDPTDPDPENPYFDKAPLILFDEESYKVPYATTFDIREIATARAAYGPYLDSKLLISVKKPGTNDYKKFSGSEYKFDKLGTYNIKYEVTDSKNDKTTTKYLKIQCEDVGVPVISGVSNKNIQYGRELDLKSKVTAKTAAGTNLKSKMVVKITRPDKKTFTLKPNKYTFKILGTYKVVYTVKNSASNKTTTKTIKVVVKDTKKPTLSGLSDKTKEYNSTYNVKSGVKAKAATGKSLTSKIKIKVTDPSGKNVKLSGNKIKLNKIGNYKIKYSVTGTNKKTATKTITINVIDTSAPVISNVPKETVKVAYKQTVDLRKSISVLTKKGTTLKSNLVVSVTTPKGTVSTLSQSVSNYCFNYAGMYTIKYSVTNPNGNKNVIKTAYYNAVYMPNLSIPKSGDYDLVNGSIDYSVLQNVTCTEKSVAMYNMMKYLSVTAEYTDENGQVSAVELTDNVLKIDKVGKYTLKYKVSGENVETVVRTWEMNVTDSTVKEDIEIKEEITGEITGEVTES